MTEAAGSPRRWRDFATRAASAAVLAPVSLWAMWAGGWPWFILLSLFAAIAIAEWVALCDMRPVSLVTGTLYILLAWAALLTLRQGGGGWPNVLFVMLVVWADDIGAYLAGRLIGGPRMAPRISPGKTWSGAAGGLLTGIAAGTGVAAAFSPGLGYAPLIAALLSIFAQAGDLLESAVKRRFGKKDSGSIIPGHGGMLDRVDGLLAAAPVAALIRLSAAHHGATLWQ